MPTTRANLERHSRSEPEAEPKYPPLMKTLHTLTLLGILASVCVQTSPQRLQRFLIVQT